MSSPKYTDDDLRRVAGIKDEQFQSILTMMLESVDSLLNKHLWPIEADLIELKTDVKTLKVALTQTNHDLQDVQRNVKSLIKRTDRLEAFADDITDHGIRLTRLEQSHSV